MTDAPGEPWQSATVTAIIPRTPRIKSFMMKLARPFEFRAGQHVDLRLTAPDGYRAMRSYSIGSAPDGTGTIELAIEYMKDGEVSPFFHDVVAVGDEIELRGPLGGYFNWTEADGGPLLLVGGGSGVVAGSEVSVVAGRVISEAAASLMMRPSPGPKVLSFMLAWPPRFRDAIALRWFDLRCQFASGARGQNSG